MIPRFSAFLSENFPFCDEASRPDAFLAKSRPDAFLARDVPGQSMGCVPGQSVHHVLAD